MAFAEQARSSPVMMARRPVMMEGGRYVGDGRAAYGFHQVGMVKIQVSIREPGRALEGWLKTGLSFWVSGLSTLVLTHLIVIGVS